MSSNQFVFVCTSAMTQLRNYITAVAFLKSFVSTVPGLYQRQVILKIIIHSVQNALSHELNECEEVASSLYSWCNVHIMFKKLSKGNLKI